MVKYTDINNQKIVRSALVDGIVRIEFAKADGTIRKMNATLQESIVPHVEKNKETKINTDTCVVWDTDIGAWRSFRWDRLQEIKEPNA